MNFAMATRHLRRRQQFNDLFEGIKVKRTDEEFKKEFNRLIAEHKSYLKMPDRMVELLMVVIRNGNRVALESGVFIGSIDLSTMSKHLIRQVFECCEQIQGDWIPIVTVVVIQILDLMERVDTNSGIDYDLCTPRINAILFKRATYLEDDSVLFSRRFRRHLIRHGSVEQMAEFKDVINRACDLVDAFEYGVRWRFEIVLDYLISSGIVRSHPILPVTHRSPVQLVAMMLKRNDVPHLLDMSPVFDVSFDTVSNDNQTFLVRLMFIGVDLPKLLCPQPFDIPDAHSTLIGDTLKKVNEHYTTIKRLIVGTLGKDLANMVIEYWVGANTPLAP